MKATTRPPPLQLFASVYLTTSRAYRRPFDATPFVLQLEGGVSMPQFTFRELYHLHGFLREELAAAAQVSTTLVDAMLCDKTVPKEEAQKVLSAVSTYAERHYTLSNVRVKLMEEGAQ